MIRQVKRFKQAIVLIGLGLGLLSVMGVLPETIGGIEAGTTKIMYAIIIGLTGVVFIKFYKKKMILKSRGSVRTEGRTEKPVDEFLPPKPSIPIEERTSKRASKKSIYEGFE